MYIHMYKGDDVCWMEVATRRGVFGTKHYYSRIEKPGQGRFGPFEVQFQTSVDMYMYVQCLSVYTQQVIRFPICQMPCMAG